MPIGRQEPLPRRPVATLCQCDSSQATFESTRNLRCCMLQPGTAQGKQQQCGFRAAKQKVYTHRLAYSRHSVMRSLAACVSCTVLQTQTALPEQNESMT
eukprot:1146840-Pelagomonas_calceolata.AAC.6